MSDFPVWMDLESNARKMLGRRSSVLITAVAAPM